MQNMIPVSHLKNYSKVIRNVKKNKPVYLTRNGSLCNALIDIEEYEELIGCREYLFEVIGEMIETNGRLNEIDKANEDEKVMSEILSEYMREVYDNEFNANNTHAEETNDLTGAELILETQGFILKSISELYEVLRQMLYDLSGIDGDVLNKIIKEHNEWK